MSNFFFFDESTNDEMNRIMVNLNSGHRFNVQTNTVQRYSYLSHSNY